MGDSSLSGAADASQGRFHAISGIVENIASILGDLDGEPVPLDGGITNRNFRIECGGRAYVLRLPGKDTNLLGIDRDAERVANERAAEIGIAPAVAAMLDEPQAIVTVFVEGTGLEPADLRAPEALAQVARALRAFHSVIEPVPATFNSFRIVEEYAELAGKRGATVPASFADAHEHAQRIEAALTGPDHVPVPCHNDLLAANFIAGAERLWIVDWEYAGMGDRYFDLANFAINNELSDAEAERLLDLYFEAKRPAGAAASLTLMRFMSDFREAMWGVLQSSVSELDFDFMGYADKHFQRLSQSAAAPAFTTALEEAADAA